METMDTSFSLIDLDQNFLGVQSLVAMFPEGAELPLQNNNNNQNFYVQETSTEQDPQYIGGLGTESGVQSLLAMYPKGAELRLQNNNSTECNEYLSSQFDNQQSLSEPCHMVDDAQAVSPHKVDGREVEPKRAVPRDVIAEDSAVINNQKTYDNRMCFMMHLFGDVKDPLHSTFTLVNNLLESQMDILFEKCENAMKLRRSNVISHEDVLFLMRRNKVLLKCLLHFLDFDGSQVLECLAFLHTIEKFKGDLTSLYNKKNIGCTAKKRFKKRKIDDSGIGRFLAKLRQIRPLHEDEFVELLCKCRFKYPARQYPFHISLLAASIIDFLAIQTVAGLVKKALCMRSRACERKRPLFSHKNFEHHIKLFKKNTEDDEPDNNALSSLSAFPKVALCPKDSKFSYSSSDFIKRMGNPPVIIPMRKKSENLATKHITPTEIQTAFMHYQRPKPMSVLMKKKLPYSQKREVNLICLAFSAEEYNEL